jgi:hypothetical protein
MQTLFELWVRLAILTTWAAKATVVTVRTSVQHAFQMNREQMRAPFAGVSPNCSMPVLTVLTVLTAANANVLTVRNAVQSVFLTDQEQARALVC